MSEANGSTFLADDLANGGNDLLAAMSKVDLEFIAARAERRFCGLDEVMGQTGMAVDFVFFVERGVASVAKVEADGRKTEICLIGPEGFTGAAVILGDGRSPYEIYSQSDLLRVVGIGSADLKELVARSSDAMRIVSGAIFAQLNQVSDNLVSAVRQAVEPRLARWLLLYRERLRSDRIEVTHAYMAIMIGSQRSKVTEALHELEASGAIAASRGLVRVIDLSTLEAVASRGLATDRPDSDIGSAP